MQVCGLHPFSTSPCLVFFVCTQELLRHPWIVSLSRPRARRGGERGGLRGARWSEDGAAAGAASPAAQLAGEAAAAAAAAAVAAGSGLPAPGGLRVSGCGTQARVGQGSQSGLPGIPAGFGLAAFEAAYGSREGSGSNLEPLLPTGSNVLSVTMSVPHTSPGGGGAASAGSSGSSGSGADGLPGSGGAQWWVAVQDQWRAHRARRVGVMTGGAPGAWEPGTPGAAPLPAAPPATTFRPSLSGQPQHQHQQAGVEAGGGHTTTAVLPTGPAGAAAAMATPRSPIPAGPASYLSPSTAGLLPHSNHTPAHPQQQHAHHGAGSNAASPFHHRHLSTPGEIPSRATTQAGASCGAASQGVGSGSAPAPSLLHQQLLQELQAAAAGGCSSGGPAPATAAAPEDKADPVTQGL